MNLFNMLFLCRWVRSRLLEYFGGETSEPDTEKITQHLNKCRHCSQYSRRLHNINDIVAHCMNDDKTAPASLSQRVINTIQTPPPPKAQSGIAFWKLAVAVCVILAVGFGAGRLSSVWPAAKAHSPMPLLHAQFDGAAMPYTSMPITNSNKAPNLATDMVIIPARFETDQVTLQKVSYSTFRQQRFVSWEYRYKGHKIVLYELNAQKIPIPTLNMLHKQPLKAQEECVIVQHKSTSSALVWCHGKYNFVMISTLPSQQLLELKKKMVIG